MEQKRWDKLPLKEKIGEFALKYQYTLIMGGWAGSLGLAAAIISRNKYQTYPQKVRRCRSDVTYAELTGNVRHFCRLCRPVCGLRG